MPKWTSKQTREEESESERDEDECVRVIDDEIYFYGDIDDRNIMEFNTKLNRLDKKLYKKSFDINGYDPEIVIHIKSEGGDVFAGLSGMDHIKSCWCKVTTVADGLCASAATFLLMGGHYRMMRPSAYILIHQLSSEFWGKYEEMKDELKSCEKFMDIIKTIYKENTKIPKKQLKNMMKRDIYLTFQECMNYGIVCGGYTS